MNSPKIILWVLLLSVVFGGVSPSQDDEFLPKRDNDFVINENKPLKDILDLGDLHSIWNFLRIHFPEVNTAYTYSCNELDFCVFDLKSKNRYLVFLSHPHWTEMKLKVDGKDVKEEIGFCYISHLFGDAKNKQNKLLGCTFSLKDGQSCELSCNVMHNFGTADFILNRDTKGWWNGTAKIQPIKK